MSPLAIDDTTLHRGASQVQDDSPGEQRSEALCLDATRLESGHRISKTKRSRDSFVFQSMHVPPRAISTFGLEFTSYFV